MLVSQFEVIEAVIIVESFISTLNDKLSSSLSLALMSILKVVKSSFLVWFGTVEVKVGVEFVGPGIGV